MLAVFNHMAEDKRKAAAGTCEGSSRASCQVSEFGCPAWLASGEREALVS